MMTPQPPGHSVTGGTAPRCDRPSSSFWEINLACSQFRVRLNPGAGSRYGGWLMLFENLSEMRAMSFNGRRLVGRVALDEAPIVGRRIEAGR